MGDVQLLTDVNGASMKDIAIHSFAALTRSVDNSNKRCLSTTGS